MIRKFLLLTLSVGIVSLTLMSYGSGPVAGGAGNRTGSGTSPINNCSIGGCHAANNNSVSVSISLWDGLTPVTKYSVGKTYRVLVAATAPSSQPEFGFQLSCVKATSTATQAGTLSTGGRSGIALRTANSIQIVEHTGPLAGSLFAGTMIDTISFNWTAATSQGRVKFFATLNAVNGDNNTTGDMPNNTSVEFDEAGVGVPSVNHSALHVYPNPASVELRIPLAAGQGADISIVDVLGKTVARRSASANGVGEAVISVRDLPAGRYYALVLQGGQLHSAPFVKN